MGPTRQDLTLAGQGIFRGAFVLSPKFVVMALRKPDQTILVRSRRRRFEEWDRRLGAVPVLRKAVCLLEWLYESLDHWTVSVQWRLRGESHEALAKRLAGGWGLVVALGFGMAIAMVAFSPALLGDGLARALAFLGLFWVLKWLPGTDGLFRMQGAVHRALSASRSGKIEPERLAEASAAFQPCPFLAFVLGGFALFAVASGVSFYGIRGEGVSGVLFRLVLVLVVFSLVSEVLDRFPKLFAGLQKALWGTASIEELEVAGAAVKEMLRLEAGASVVDKLGRSKFMEHEMVVRSIREIPDV